MQVTAQNELLIFDESALLYSGYSVLAPNAAAGSRDINPGPGAQGRGACGDA